VKPAGDRGRVGARAHERGRARLPLGVTPEMEYVITNVNGRAEYRARPRAPKRGNQIAILIAAAIIVLYGPLRLPFLMSTQQKTLVSRTRATGFLTQVAPYEEVVATLQHLERNGIQYAQVQLSKTSRGAVFHVLPDKRLDGVVVLLDGCGSAIDRHLGPEGRALLQSVGRANFLPMTIELPAVDTAGACPESDALLKRIPDVVESVRRLVRLSGTVGLSLVFATVGDGVTLGVSAMVMQMIEAAMDAEKGGPVAQTATVVYGVRPPDQLLQKWTSILGIQKSVRAILIAPNNSAEDAATRARVARADAALEQNGVSLTRIHRRCNDCLVSAAARRWTPFPSTTR